MTNDPSAARTIAQTLMHCRVDHLAQAETDGLLAKLRDHVVEHGGDAKGSVTIKLDFTFERGVVATKASVKVATPSAPAIKGLAYMTEDGVLTARDPNQYTLKHVDAPATSRDVIDAD